MKNHNVQELLKNNSYPGRGLILGRSADGRFAAAAYFIMGRSKNSRNRVFEKTTDGIRTQAFDPSAMEDPSLIIYHPVREFDGCLIVTNGDQTDTIRDSLQGGGSFRDALRTREFEPDAPNYTPRVSGIIYPDGGYRMSILKTMDGDPECCCRYFYEYDAPAAGVGHFIHTYISDGDPLPSFEGEPERIDFPWQNARAFANALWESLDNDNKVSLFTRYIEIATGKSDTVIINKNV